MTEYDEVQTSGDLDDYVARVALAEAQKAVREFSYGVGGILVDIRTKRLIHYMHNTVIARENPTERHRLKDPTAHGERQLVDWYCENRQNRGLPDPHDIMIITTLDPCCMCTGSILSVGFRAVVAALDDQAGINWNNSTQFSPFEGRERELIRSTFIYPEVIGDPHRPGYGTVPTFDVKTLQNNTVGACLETFVKGAKAARGIINDIVELKDARDIRSLPASHEIVRRLTAEYPPALSYRARDFKRPDKGLAPYLIDAARGGRDHDAVAFLDCFGNLLMCRGSNKDQSPIRTAYFETIRAYQRVRYELSAYDKEALHYLCEPKFGTFVFVKGFDKGAQSFADLGAYGSTILGTLENEANLQYVTPRIDHGELERFIKGMPPRYSSLIKPRRVEDRDLIQAVESAL